MAGHRPFTARKFGVVQVCGSRVAERNAMTDHRKMNAARRLKSLNNFWWSSSAIAAIAAGAS
jgi:hypothetical protein